MAKINFYNMDCMEFMRNIPDKAYDLAIVDPPYDGGVMMRHSTVASRDSEACSTSTEQKSGARRRQGLAARVQKSTRMGDENIRFWDYAPSQEYFDELFRVSRNQIIWGGNYFSLPPARCFLIWRKLSISESFSMAMCEYAWTSFNDNAKIFECAPQGTAKEKRFHPTQKPVKLYTWILENYAKPGMRLLDTHGGSMSSAVAAVRLGYDMDIIEINTTYFENGKARTEAEMRQPNLFDAGTTMKQGDLL